MHAGLKTGGYLCLWSPMLDQSFLSGACSLLRCS